MEYLELAASFEEQLEYERRATIAYVPSELINQWDDWVPDVRRPWSVYSQEEAAAMIAFEEVLDRANRATGEGWPSVTEVQTLPAWSALRDAAAAALAVFGRRGRLPEDHEVAD